MSGFSVFLNENLLSIVVVLGILVLVLLSVSTTALLSVCRLKKRYELFTGAKRRPDYNMELQFTQFHQEAQQLEKKWEALDESVRDLQARMSKCVQKVGVVRYNPFDEVGGNLCYAIALLDASDNGVVLNGIHSRTGSFTYAKPIELGVSEYILSTEEQQALDLALANSYTPLEREQVLEETEEAVQSYTEKAKELVSGVSAVLPEGDVSTPVADEMYETI